MLNKVILMGRLTRDPELRYTQSNLPVVSFSLAVDRNRTGNNQKRQTDFINVVAWRRTAEFVSQWFSKGMLMVVVGSLQSREWQDNDGNRRTAIEVNAEEVQFGETKKSRESSGGYQRNHQQGENRQGQNSYSAQQANANSAPQQTQPTPSYDMPANEPDFAEFDDDTGEVPW